MRKKIVAIILLLVLLVTACGNQTSEGTVDGLIADGRTEGNGAIDEQGATEDEAGWP